LTSFLSTYPDLIHLFPADFWEHFATWKAKAQLFGKDNRGIQYIFLFPAFFRIGGYDKGDIRTTYFLLDFGILHIED
jgi:hypothetical protein